MAAKVCVSVCACVYAYVRFALWLFYGPPRQQQQQRALAKCENGKMENAQKKKKKSRIKIEK